MDRISAPLDGGGNALDPPGFSSRSGDPVQVVQVTGPTYSPGDWVEVSVPNAVLYSREPRAGDQPSLTLPQGTPLKVVATSGTYVKGELETGRVGFIPAIMVSQKEEAQEVPLMPEGPEEVVTPPPYTQYGQAPEPEVPPISVEDAMGVPSMIDPGDETIE